MVPAARAAQVRAGPPVGPGPTGVVGGGTAAAGERHRQLVAERLRGPRATQIGGPGTLAARLRRGWSSGSSGLSPASPGSARPRTRHPSPGEPAFAPARAPSPPGTAGAPAAEGWRPAGRRPSRSAQPRRWTPRRSNACGNRRILAAPSRSFLSHATGPASRSGCRGVGRLTSEPVRTPSRSAISSATRRALAMMVSVGFTAVLETKKLESAT